MDLTVEAGGDNENGEEVFVGKKNNILKKINFANESRCLDVKSRAQS